MPSREGPFFRSCVAAKMSGYRICRYSLNWQALLVALASDELELKAFVVERAIVAAFLDLSNKHFPLLLQIL